MAPVRFRCTINGTRLPDVGEQILKEYLPSITGRSAIDTSDAELSGCGRDLVADLSWLSEESSFIRGGAITRHHFSFCVQSLFLQLQNAERHREQRFPVLRLLENVWLWCQRTNGAMQQFLPIFVCLGEISSSSFLGGQHSQLKKEMRIFLWSKRHAIVHEPLPVVFQLLDSLIDEADQSLRLVYRVLGNLPPQARREVQESGGRISLALEGNVSERIVQQLQNMLRDKPDGLGLLKREQQVNQRLVEDFENEEVGFDDIFQEYAVPGEVVVGYHKALPGLFVPWDGVEACRRNGLLPSLTEGGSDREVDGWGDDHHHWPSLPWKLTRPRGLLV